jgi:hypothetical protein
MFDTLALYLLNFIISILSASAFLWAPIILVIIAWKMWYRYVQHHYITTIKWKLLEIKLPREIYKSPEAMEWVLMNSFHQSGGAGNWFDRYWNGKVINWYSLEIASIEGVIHFFVRIPESAQKLVTSQIYAQYPDTEVTEVDDYMDRIPPFSPSSGYEMEGVAWKLEKSDAWPIRTYIDFGMDKAIGKLDENMKLDPMTPLLEFLGTIGKNEQVWIQYVIRFSTERYHKKDAWPKKEKWADIVKAELAKFVKDEVAASVKAGLINKDDAEKGSKMNFLSDAKKEVVKALERHATKPPFDVGMRMVYIAKSENFNKNIKGGLSSVFKQYGSPYLNGLKTDGDNSTGGADFAWQEFTSNRKTRKKIHFFKMFKLRSYFTWPGKYISSDFPSHTMFGDNELVPFVLTTEELASLYHFPSSTAETPTLPRTDSKKTEAPANLPL